MGQSLIGKKVKVRLPDGQVVKGYCTEFYSLVGCYEVYYFGTKTYGLIDTESVSLDTSVPCRDCHGTKVVPGGMDCPTCLGTGEDPDITADEISGGLDFTDVDYNAYPDPHSDKE